MACLDRSKIEVGSRTPIFSIGKMRTLRPRRSPKNDGFRDLIGPLGWPSRALRAREGKSVLALARALHDRS